MALLMLFALVAGAGTALSPCVLPVLPALLSAGVTGGRRRPVGIALGLAATFTVTIVGLASVIDGVGLGPGLTRTLAVVVLIGFGIVVAVPSLAARLEAPLARLSRLGPRSRGDGFASGLLVGAALGFVYAPCAGPILAAVIAVGAASSRTVPVGLAFALGSALVLLALSLGGRALAGRVRATGRGPGLQRALAAVLILTGVAMATNLDVRFQSAIADHLPAALVNPTHGLETSHAVSSRLNDLRGPSRFAVAATGRQGVEGRAPAAPGRRPGLHRQPALVQHARRPAAEPRDRCAARSCSSTSGPTPASTACARCPTSRRGTRATAATASSSSASTRPSSPSSATPATWRPPSGARGSAIPWRRTTSSRRGTRGATSTGPPTTSIDARGQVRGAHFGEGDYDRTEMDIRALLKEAGHPNPGAMADPKGAVHPTRAGDARDLPGPGARRALRPAAAARHAHLRAGAQARDEPLRAVGHLGRERRRRDGPRRRRHPRRDRRQGRLSRPQPAAGRRGRRQRAARRPPDPPHRAGADVHHGVVRVDRQRLYHLVSAPAAEHHVLTLRVGRSPGLRLHVRIASPRDARDRAGAAGREGAQRVGGLRPHTRVAALSLSGVPSGARVVLRCRGGGARSRQSCHRGAPRVSLTRAFRHVRLRVGANVDVRVSEAAHGDVAVRFIVRSGKPPAKQRSWLALQPPPPAPGPPLPAPPGGEPPAGPPAGQLGPSSSRRSTSPRATSARPSCGRREPRDRLR